jgi:hypothetical protein
MVAKFLWQTKSKRVSEWYDMYIQLFLAHNTQDWGYQRGLSMWSWWVMLLVIHVCEWSAPGLHPGRLKLHARSSKSTLTRIHHHILRGVYNSRCCTIPMKAKPKQVKQSKSRLAQDERSRGSHANTFNAELSVQWEEKPNRTLIIAKHWLLINHTLHLFSRISRNVGVFLSPQLQMWKLKLSRGISVERDNTGQILSLFNRVCP